jgi:hypothetical protein
MTNTAPPRTDRTRSSLLALVGLAAAAALLLVVALLGIGALVDAGSEESSEPLTEPAADVRLEKVSAQTYESVPLDATKEDVLAALRPAEPVDVSVLDRYDTRSPETLASSCVYFDSEGIRVGALYRFCFSNEVLVDKTVILPRDEG